MKSRARMIHGLSLKSPKEDLDFLKNADEIVLPFKSAILIIDYPLTNPASFQLSTREDGFSRKALVEEISKKYYSIYEEEKKNFKRDSASGQYGIWEGESMNLYLGAIEVYKNSSGKVYMILEVMSY